MPNYPKPASQWFARQFAGHGAGLQELNAIKAQQGALSTLSDLHSGTGFSPTVAGAWQQPSSGGHPSVTATVGTSGRVLLFASATITVPTTAATPEQATVGYAITPPVGSPLGPFAVASFGSTASGPAGATIQLLSTVSIIEPLDNLTAGTSLFELWYKSSVTTSVTFSAMTLTVWPL